MSVDKPILIHIYNRLFYGKKKLEYTEFEFRRRREQLEPTIFLSTGRCGTRWLTERLEKSSTHVPIHHPKPVMRVQARMMYSYDFESIDDGTFDLLSEIFLAGREEIFVLGKRADKELAITDSRGSFFAYIIAALFPKARFVFVHRHPLEVIRSGLKRGWYSMQNASELNRITPLQGSPYFEKWDAFSPTQKNAWLWTETNRWILDFLETIAEDRKHTIGFNDWNTEELMAMFDFVNADIPKGEIDKNLRKKSNAQKSSLNPGFEKWTEADRREAIAICGELAQTLNYTF